MLSLPDALQHSLRRAVADSLQQAENPEQHLAELAQSFTRVLQQIPLAGTDAVAEIRRRAELAAQLHQVLSDLRHELA